VFISACIWLQTNHSVGQYDDFHPLLCGICFPSHLISILIKFIYQLSPVNIPFDQEGLGKIDLRHHYAGGVNIII
jgi:hypothetical protein